MAKSIQKQSILFKCRIIFSCGIGVIRRAYTRSITNAHAISWYFSHDWHHCLMSFRIVCQIKDRLSHTKYPAKCFSENRLMCHLYHLDLIHNKAVVKRTTFRHSYIHKFSLYLQWLMISCCFINKSESLLPHDVHLLTLSSLSDLSSLLNTYRGLNLYPPLQLVFHYLVQLHNLLRHRRFFPEPASLHKHGPLEPYLPQRKCRRLQQISDN